MHDGWLIAIFGSAPNDQDHWEIDEAAGILRRHHVKARLDMFVPTSIGCPIPTEQLTEERRTVADPYDKAGSKLVISDTWTRRDSYRHLMGEDRWTGVTEFKVVQEKADEEETTDPVQRLAEESEKQQAQEEEEDTTMDIAEGDSDQGVIRAPMKPLYDFRRVLHRLPRLAEHDHLQAERLLLGLHERFWRRSWRHDEPADQSRHAQVSDRHDLQISGTMQGLQPVHTVAQPTTGQDGPRDYVQPGDPGGLLLSLGEHVHADHRRGHPVQDSSQSHEPGAAPYFEAADDQLVQMVWTSKDHHLRPGILPHES